MLPPKSIDESFPYSSFWWFFWQSLVFLSLWMSRNSNPVSSRDLLPSLHMSIFLWGRQPHCIGSPPYASTSSEQNYMQPSCFQIWSPSGVLGVRTSTYLLWGTELNGWQDAFCPKFLILIHFLFKKKILEIWLVKYMVFGKFSLLGPIPIFFSLVSLYKFWSGYKAVAYLMK